MKKKEVFIIRIIKFIGRIIYFIFLFFVSIFKDLFLVSKKDKKKINVKVNQEKVKIKINDNYYIDIPDSLNNKTIKEINKEDIKNLTKEIFLNKIDKEYISLIEEPDILDNLSNKVIPIINENIKKEEIKVIPEIIITINELVDKEIKEKQEVVEKEIINLSDLIKTIYLKEIKQENMYMTKKEDKLLLEIEKKIIPLINELIDSNDLEIDIKENIRNYIIEQIKENKVEEYLSDALLNKYINKVIEENKRITLIRVEEPEYIEEIKKEQGTGLIPAASSFNETTIPQNTINVNDDINYSKIENLNNKEEIKEPKEDFIKLDLRNIEENTFTLENETNKELKKEELEDKEYEILEAKINNLLNILSKEKNKNIDNLTKQKIILEEQKLINLKNNLQSDKENLIEKERMALHEKITLKEINGIEEEINKLYSSDLVKKIDFLENLSLDKQKEMRKYLIKHNLKKACKWSRVPLLFSLPFVRNKFFMFFTGSVMFYHHLNIYNSVLNNKKVKKIEETLTDIEYGVDALDAAINKTRDNEIKLNNLIMNTYLEFPEFRYNKEFIKYEKIIRKNINNTSNKLNRRKEVINKYHIKNESLIRKLKKIV